MMMMAYVTDGYVKVMAVYVTDVYVKDMAVYVTDGYVKDMAKKYAGHWLSLSCARRLRLNEQWWKESLQPYTVQDSEMDHSENQHIRGICCNSSLPYNYL